jgi:hypothetical protein
MEVDVNVKRADSLVGGFAQKGQTWWRRYLQAVSPPQTPLITCQESTEPVLVPCRGRVYSFQLFPLFTWRSLNLDDVRMRVWIHHFSPQANARLRREAAELASQFAPQDGEPFAEELNRRLDRTAWRFDRERVELTCQVWCRVELDEAIRTALQPLCRERIELEERWKLDRQRADVARDITEAWSVVIEKLQENPFSEPAAALGDERFAGTFVRWREEQRKEIESLLRLLEDANRGVKRVGAYESAEIFDATLEALRKRHGLLTEERVV